MIAHSAEAGPFGQQVGPLLEPLAGVVQVAGLTLADGDHELIADEHADLAEVDLLGLLVVARGAEHDERLRAGVVLLDLGPQVQRLRVLDGEVVQPEPALDVCSSSLLGSNSPIHTNPSSGSSQTSAARSRSMRPSC